MKPAQDWFDNPDTVNDGYLVTLAAMLDEAAAQGITATLPAPLGEVASWRWEDAPNGTETGRRLYIVNAMGRNYFTTPRAIWYAVKDPTLPRNQQRPSKTAVSPDAPLISGLEWVPVAGGDGLGGIAESTAPKPPPPALNGAPSASGLPAPILPGGVGWFPLVVGAVVWWFFGWVPGLIVVAGSTLLARERAAG